MKKLFFILSFLLLQTLTLIAQEVVKDGDTTVYYQDYSDLVTLKMLNQIKISDITFNDSEQEKELVYAPNELLKLGVGLNYKWIGFNVAFLPVGQTQEDKEKYGTTKAFDIQMDFFTRKFGGQFHLIRYRGFYWDNPENYITDFSPDLSGYPKRPDIQLLSYGFNAFYNFNHKKFSFRAAFIHNERQVKSAGSFLAGGYFNRLNIQSMSDSTYLLPYASIGQLNEELDVNEITTFNFGAMGGYAHTFVIYKRVFVTLGAVLGLGFENIDKYYKFEDNKSDFVVNALFNFRGALGFNSKDFYFGLNANSIRSSIGVTDNTSMSYVTGTIRMVWAYRFRSKALDTLYDKTVGKIIKL